MQAYSKAYLDEVVENQGKLFDLYAQDYPNNDTEDFIQAYMKSKTRKYIDLTTQEKVIILNLIDAKVLTDLGFDGRDIRAYADAKLAELGNTPITKALLKTKED